MLACTLNACVLASYLACLLERYGTYLDATPSRHLPCLQQASRVIQGGRLEVPPAERLPGDTPSSEGLAAYIALLHSCWDQNPGKRPTFPQIVSDFRCVLQRWLPAGAGVFICGSPHPQCPPTCHSTAAGCECAGRVQPRPVPIHIWLASPGTVLQDHAGHGGWQQGAISGLVGENQHTRHATRHRLVPCAGDAVDMTNSNTMRLSPCCRNGIAPHTSWF